MRATAHVVGDVIGRGGEAVRRDVELAAARGDIALKRALDVVLAAILMVLALPLVVVISALVLAESRGPLQYSCTRVGQHGRPIRVLKFRKMRDGACGPALTVASDPRFTRLGGWLAATKIDELPQLWNVLRGDMSLVGPRPEDASFVAVRGDDYRSILAVKPGITGLSQLAFARESQILTGADAVECYVERLLPQKVGIDLLYAQRRNVAMDLVILVWTPVALVLRRDVAVDRATGRLTLRRRGHEPGAADRDRSPR